MLIVLHQGFGIYSIIIHCLYLSWGQKLIIFRHVSLTELGPWPREYFNRSLTISWTGSDKLNKNYYFCMLDNILTHIFKFYRKSTRSSNLHRIKTMFKHHGCMSLECKDLSWAPYLNRWYSPFYLTVLGRGRGRVPLKIVIFSKCWYPGTPGSLIFFSQSYVCFNI